MNYSRAILGFLFLFLSQVGMSQKGNDLALFRQDIKEITGKNTVSVTSYEKGGEHYVYAGGVGNVDVYNLDKNGLLTPVSKHELYKGQGPARGMVADNINGSDYLFVANKHGDVIETFGIKENGSLERVALTHDTEDTYLGTAITLQVIHMEESSYLFVGGLEETPGLSSFKILDNGELQHVQSMEDDETIHTDGVIGMFVHRIANKTFLYTSGFHDNGVSSFRVFKDGKFEKVNSISDNTTDRYLTGAYPVTGLSFGKDKYVVVGHRHHKYYKRGGFIKRPNFVYHGDAVSVFKINGDGALIPHYVLKDDETSKLQGQTRIEVVSSNDQEAILAVGTRDDASIQLCRLSKDGILSPISYLETGFSIYYGLRSHPIGEDNFLIAGSFRFDLGKIVSYKVGPKINYDGKVLRHLVSLKYKEEASAEEVEKAVEVFLNLKNEIPEIEAIEWGVNDSKEGNSKGLTHCFTITFKDEHAREVYLFHKAHLDLVKKVGPIIGDVLVLDYWTE